MSFSQFLKEIAEGPEGFGAVEAHGRRTCGIIVHTLGSQRRENPLASESQSKRMLESHKLQGVCQGQKMTLIRTGAVNILRLIFNIAVNFIDSAFGKPT